MRSILADRRTELLADCSFLGLCWISCAHQIAPGLHRAASLQHHDDARCARHEFRKAVIERLAAMNFIKAFGLFSRLMNHLHGANPKTAGDDAINDSSRVPRADGVRLDDCERKIVHFSNGPVNSKANLSALLSSIRFSCDSEPTKSVNADFRKLTSSSQ